MAHYTDELEKVCEAVVKTLAKANRKIEATGGELKHYFQPRLSAKL